LAREVDAALARLSAGGDAHEADGGPHEAWSPCMAIKISGAAHAGTTTSERPKGPDDRARDPTLVEHRRGLRDPHRDQ